MFLLNGVFVSIYIVLAYTVDEFENFKFCSCFVVVLNFMCLIIQDQMFWIVILSVDLCYVIFTFHMIIDSLNKNILF